ncbi:VIT family protein [Chlamydia ibidis]|uniref:VIT family protein n=2 Tax=Chlamydia ibidis TaxID=1405396 RepID=S7KEG2_9CHLA|nr:VIT1/CCC1 transporter family protein [Chlamydia ibidis]EPP34591.1 VIT family protein [Chlamydia ibidis]EQM62247.1 VIT family protein [Chlamydia ibidis 10-1398/6]
MQTESHDHFKSQTAENHLKSVKDKNKVCIGEPHTTIKGFIYHLASDALATGVFLFFIRSLFFCTPMSHNIGKKMLLSLGIGWVFYRGCLKAKKAWSYMELSHRCMLQEKKEIESNPLQERQELKAIYANHGFKGDLLESIVDYIASDSTLLLDTMIREELHISIEDFPHPLKQGGTRFLGGIIGLVLFLPFVLCASYTVAGIISSLFILSLSVIKAKILNNDVITESIWVVGIFLTSISITLALVKLL